MLKKGVNILLGTSNETLKQIFRALADSLNVSETTTKEIIASYEVVGTYLGHYPFPLAGFWYYLTEVNLNGLSRTMFFL